MVFRVLCISNYMCEINFGRDCVDGSINFKVNDKAVL